MTSVLHNGGVDFCHMEFVMTAIRIAMIGAGETGTPLLRQLLDAPFVELDGLADLDLEQPGIALAREHGRPVTTDFRELARDASIDILIDVTGVPAVRETLRQIMQDTRNEHTLIMHERIALLMLSLSAGHWIDGKHDNEHYV